MRAWLTAPVIGEGTSDDPYRPAIADAEKAEGDRHEYVIHTDADGRPTSDTALCAVDVADIVALGGTLIEPAHAIDIGRKLSPTFDAAAHLTSSEPPNPGSFLNDTFTDTDGTLLSAHTGEQGATWAKHPNYATTSEIKTNRATASSLTDSLYYASGVSGSNEYDVQAVLFVVTLPANFATGVVGRYSTTVDTGYIVHAQSGNQWAMFKAVAGTFTSIGTFAQTLTVGNSYTAILQIRTAAKKLFVDGVERISSADNVNTAIGVAGTRINSSPTAGIHIDQITATDANAVASTNQSLLLMGLGS